MTKSLPFTANIIDEEQRLVEGFLGDDGVDLDGHMINRSSYQRAIDEFMRWGNVRQMHEDPVGVIVSHGEKSWNHIVAKIVDDRAWNYIKNGIYKGFSIGARVLATSWKNISEIPEEMFYGLPDIIKDAIMEAGKVLSLDSILITEISLVDRPANPRALILAYKSLVDENDRPLPVSTEVLAAQEKYYKGEKIMDKNLEQQVANEARRTDENETPVAEDVATQATVNSEEAQSDTLTLSVSDNSTDVPNITWENNESVTVDLTELLTLSETVKEFKERLDGLETKISGIDMLQKSIVDLSVQVGDLTKALAESVTAAANTIDNGANSADESEDISQQTDKSLKAKKEEKSFDAVVNIGIDEIISRAVDAAVAKYIKSAETHDERQNTVNRGDIEKKLESESIDGRVDFKSLDRNQKYKVLARTMAANLTN